MISNYISKLLKIHNRVIVPGLGAFLVKGEENKSISFNEFLRFNDGLLLGYVADQEHIEIMDAAKIIKSFAEEINKKLYAERTAEVEGIGTLYLDDNDKIQIRNPHLNYQDKFQSNNETGIKNIKKNKSQPTIIETNSQTDKQFNFGYEEEKFESPNYPESIISSGDNKYEKHSRLISIITSKNVIVIAGFLVIFLVLAYILLTHQESKTRKIANDGFGKDTIFEKIPLIKKNNSLVKNTAKSKPDTINHSDSEISSLTSKPPLEHGNTVSVSSKPESKPESIKHNTENKNRSDINNFKRYYIVAGCFSEELNANKLVEKLKSEGYLSEKFATIRNLHYVCYASYNNKDSASAELTKLSLKGKFEAWIMFYTNF